MYRKAIVIIAVSFALLTAFTLLSPPSYAATERIYSTSTIVTNGIEVTIHTLSHLSDDQWYQINATHSQPSGEDYAIDVSMLFSTTLEPTKLTQIDVFSEAHVLYGVRPVVVYIYNYGTLLWESLFSVSATSDASHVYSLIANLTNYVGAGGEMKLRVYYKVSGNKPQTFYQDHTYIELLTIAPENHPPVLDPISPKSVDELSLLTFTATATDPDNDTLTFSLGPGAPEGASINATTGVFTWTPTEMQGPGVHIIRIIVSDGSLTDFEDVSVTVNEVNVAPVLDPIGPKSVNELELLTFTATATDSDVPAQTLTFSLGAPTGASINSTTGVFTWTPIEAQGPGIYTIRVIVSDGSFEDFEDVNVTVNEVNLAPVLGLIGTRLVNELSLLTFTATASDPDIPVQTLTYSLGAGAPEGASINDSTGVFTWTPTEAQGPGSYIVRIIVSDGSLTDYEDVPVSVYEVNTAPVLDPIGAKSVDELQLLTFTATASDSDIPVQPLAFSLGAGAPAGASINASTGVFTWTPTEAQGPGNYTIKIIVSDGSLEDFEDVKITVNEVAAHDVAVLSVTPSGTQVYGGNPFNVTVVVKNKVAVTETFDVSVFAYNVTYNLNYTVGTQKNVTLAPEETKTLTFPWDTTLVRACTFYTIEAKALLPTDFDPSDNVLTDGSVHVMLMGDVNNDRIVDVFDLIKIGIAFGSKPGEPDWNPKADLNNDGIIDVYDLIKAAINFGKTC